jgi:hypothetical protein
VDIFDCPAFDLVFAGFSSCFNNDLYNRQASIHPACIARALRALRQPGLAKRIRVGVWHHNTEGLPANTDYLDPDVLQNLIDGGFSLGLHGHQHRPQFLDTRFKYGVGREIKVISAGTLCGSASFRYGRAYNLIELDTQARTLPTSSQPYFEFSFEAPEPGEPTNAKTTSLVRAQKLFDIGKLREAADIVNALLGFEELARPLLLECLVRLPDPLGLVAAFDPPQSEAEAIHLMDALWEVGKKPRLAEVLSLPLISGSTDQSVIEIRNKYRARLR